MYTGWRSMKSKQGRGGGGRKVKHVDSPDGSRNLHGGACGNVRQGGPDDIQLQKGSYKPLTLNQVFLQGLLCHPLCDGKWGAGAPALVGAKGQNQNRSCLLGVHHVGRTQPEAWSREGNGVMFFSPDLYLFTVHVGNTFLF